LSFHHQNPGDFSIRHGNISQVAECLPRDSLDSQFLWRPGAGVANESKPGRNFPKDKRDGIFHFRSGVANVLRPF